MEENSMSIVMTVMTFLTIHFSAAQIGFSLKFLWTLSGWMLNTEVMCPSSSSPPWKFWPDCKNKNFNFFIYLAVKSIILLFKSPNNIYCRALKKEHVTLQRPLRPRVVITAKGHIELFFCYKTTFPKILSSQLL